MAKDSKARKAREAAELKKKNAEMKARLAAQRQIARTDDNLDDEEAGRMRHELAKRSKERKAREAAALSKSNSKVFMAIAKTDNKEDDDIMGVLPVRGKLLRASRTLRVHPASLRVRPACGACTTRLCDAHSWWRLPCR